MFAAFQVDSLRNDLGAVFLLLVMTTPVSLVQVLVLSRRQEQAAIIKY